MLAEMDSQIGIGSDERLMNRKGSCRFLHKCLEKIDELINVKDVEKKNEEHGEYS